MEESSLYDIKFIGMDVLTDEFSHVLLTEFDHPLYSSSMFTRISYTERACDEIEHKIFHRADREFRTSMETALNQATGSGIMVSARKPKPWVVGHSYKTEVLLDMGRKS